MMVVLWFSCNFDVAVGGCEFGVDLCRHGHRKPLSEVSPTSSGKACLCKAEHWKSVSPTKRQT